MKLNIDLAQTDDEGWTIEGMIKDAIDHSLKDEMRKVLKAEISLRITTKFIQDEMDRLMADDEFVDEVEKKSIETVAKEVSKRKFDEYLDNLSLAERIKRVL